MNYETVKLHEDWIVWHVYFDIFLFWVHKNTVVGHINLKIILYSVSDVIG